MRTLLTASLLALVVTACGAGDDDDAPGAVLDGGWIAVSGISDGSDVALVDGYPVTITIQVDSGRVEGTAACNGYSGSAEIGGDGSFSTADLSWTEIGCEAAVMSVEQAYLASLARFTNYAVVDDVLTLSSATDEWVFEPATTPG